MANIQIGKYKRPGIFIEEFDQSVISSPVVEGITNLIIGSSKKGPINTPIRLTTVADLEAIFGPLDRQLERKGSFFHRTVSKMLEIAPVFAMNLLLTDDELDRIEYKSLSASSEYLNDIKREGPYRRFFDTTGFFKRDTDSFINLTKTNPGFNERALSITNLSDRPISVFIYKSDLSGFDRTLLEWYGSIDKMPSYVNAQDFASDYLVDVVVVGGDWSNYQELAVDPRWSSYFNASGLIKGEIENFANDRNISLLAYYEGLSLIPYFRDLNGRNIFIENVINRDTDRSGLFCAFNNDLVEEDFYNGNIDLIGNTVVGKNETEINFLSYKEIIAEEISMTSTPLDLPGNVIGLVGNSSYQDQERHAFNINNLESPKTSGIVRNGNRTSWFAEGSVYGLKSDIVLDESTTVVTTFNVTNSEAQEYIINSESNPRLELNEGETYTFNVNSPGHPFAIKTISGIGGKNAYTDGVIVNSGIATQYAVTVDNDGAANIFKINSDEKPELNLVRGGVYYFEQSDISNVDHQIAFKDGDGNLYTSGVVTTGTLGTTGAQTVITVPFDAPDDLRYYCIAHANYMGNIINVSSGIEDGTIIFTVPVGAPTLYYNCQVHGSMTNTILISQSLPEFSIMKITFTSTDGFAVIGGEHIELETKTFSFDANDYPESATSSVVTFYLSQNGEINFVKSENSNKPNVSQSDIVLGYVTTDLVADYPFIKFLAPIYNPVTIDTNGFVDLIHGDSDDYKVEDLGSGSVKINFLNTNSQASTSNYEQFRRFRVFNQFVATLDSPNRVRSTMNLGITYDYNKFSLKGVSITEIVNSSTQNKSFTLNGLPANMLSNILDGYLVAYAVDNEFILGRNGIITKSTTADLTNEGVVAEFSTFYSRFFNGIINTRDFFYTNRLYVDSSGFATNMLGKEINVEFISGIDIEGAPESAIGNDYIIFQNPDFGNLDLLDGEQILIPRSIKNKGSFTIVSDPSLSTSGSSLAITLGYEGGDFFAYRVNEKVEYEELIGIDIIYDFINRAYLKMYLENTGELIVKFRDELLESEVSIDARANNVIFVQSRKSNLKQTLEIEIPDNYTIVPNKILVNASRYTEVKVGDFLEAFVNLDELEIGQTPRKLTRILSKRLFAGDTSLVEITTDARIRTYNFSGDIQTMRYVSMDNYASTYKCISLKGFRIRQASLPDGTESRQNQILNIVAKGTPLFKAVTNKEAIDFRYLIDSFGLGLTERSKQQLVDICGSRLDAFGFLNMPSMRSFKNSSSPSFVNNEGVLQTEFIGTGGDPESNPAFLYSFGEGAGTTCVGYFAPYVSVNDNGRPLDMPPASYVATTYMRKHISNITSITPWTIAAGVNNGRITNITGLEIDFTPEDIEYLNTAQMNPIVFKRNRGFVIETQNTGQTLFSSALSFINVREVLIELERELSSMLLDYQWKFNTPDVRAEIKLRADVICETYVSKNGLFNYFNKMDDENNTPELIDNQIGILDTFVEPIKGMGIIVNNITILRTGAISAGGFINS